MGATEWEVQWELFRHPADSFDLACFHFFLLSNRKISLGTGIVAQQVKLPQGSYMRLLVWIPAAVFPIQLFTNALGKHQKWAKFLGPFNSSVGPRWSFGLLRLTWPILGHCVSIWGVNQWMEQLAWSFSFSFWLSFLSLRLSNKCKVINRSF